MSLLKVGTTPRGGRIWLQGLDRFGWNGGDTYTSTYAQEAIILTKSTEGKTRKVTAAKGGIIDLHGQAVTKWAQGAAQVAVTYTETSIVITRA